MFPFIHNVSNGRSNISDLSSDSLAKYLMKCSLYAISRVGTYRWKNFWMKFHFFNVVLTWRSHFTHHVRLGGVSILTMFSSRYSWWDGNTRLYCLSSHSISNIYSVFLWAIQVAWQGHFFIQSINNFVCRGTS